MAQYQIYDPGLYVEYSDGVNTYRVGSRNNNFVVDKELYYGGFNDIEGVGWTNREERIYVGNIQYGALYNWYAATNILNIANTGWHVPTAIEITTLVTYLGGDSVAGGPLKETGLTFWSTPNTGASNSSYFNARGSGGREGGVYLYILDIFACWASTYVDASYAYHLQLDYNSTDAIHSPSSTLKVNGLSIRLIKDSTILTNGQTSTYTGNDGKIYRTICIGTQEWVADNLIETKYRDDSDITIETDGPTWDALTTEAMCYYNNDIVFAITNTGVWRDGVRNTQFVIDTTLNAMGFDGIESTDNGLNGDWLMREYKNVP